MAADEISVETSMGNVVLYVEPDGWAKVFMMNEEGTASGETQALIQGLGSLSLVKPFGLLS